MSGQYDLYFFFRNESGEVFERPVVCFLRIRREEATRYLPLGNVILYTIATDTLSRTRRIRTGAERFVFVDFTFHKIFEG